MPEAIKAGGQSVSGAAERTRTQNVLVAAVAAAAVTPITLTSASANQGNMEAALNHLEQAIQSLRQATPNKGGHRERAIQMCETAMAEVQAGIDYAGG